MKTEDFLVELEDILQREEPCNVNDALTDYEEWDSLSKMAVMAYYKKNFGVDINLNTLKEINTVDELIKLAGDKIID
ncbi:acyl carrier protein [bacterium]|nr:acyl carrier protein [bacterium]